MAFGTRSVDDFLEALASPAPTPGGGTAAAMAGAMGAALLAMVAGLPRTRSNSDDERHRLQRVREDLLPLVQALQQSGDRDSAAYDAVLTAYRLPKASDDDKRARTAAVAQAMRGATEAPLQTLRLVVEALERGGDVGRHGNPSASSDIGVAAGLLGAAAEGAAANVRVNLDGLADATFRDAASAEADALVARAAAGAAAIRSGLA